LSRQTELFERLVRSRIEKPKHEWLDTAQARIWVAYGKARDADCYRGFWMIDGAAYGPMDGHPGKSALEVRDAILDHAANLLLLAKPRGLVQEGRIVAH